MVQHYDPEKIASYVENLIVGICHLKLADGKITPVYFNEGFGRMLGYGRQEMEMLMEHIEHSIIPEDLPVMHQGIADILKDDGPVECVFRTVTLNGGLRWLQVTGNLYSRNQRESTFVCVVTDITEKMAMEEENLDQAERLDLFTEPEQEILVDYNARTDVMHVRHIERGGIPKDEIFQKYVETFNLEPYYPDDIESLLGLYRQLLRAPGRGVIEYRHKYFSKDYRWFRLALSSIADNNGYVTRMVGRMLDIQEEKRKELTGQTEKSADLIAQAVGHTAGQKPGGKKKSWRDGSYTDMNGQLDLEELVLDILCEETDLREGLETVLGILSERFGWRRAYAYSDAAAFLEGKPALNCAVKDHQGTEEKWEDKLRRAEILESLCDYQHKMTIYHEYDGRLNDEQLRYMMENGVHAIVYYPFIVNNKYAGCIALEHTKWTDIVLDQGEMLLLKSVLRILDVYLQNSSILRKIPNIITKLKLIDNLDNYVYVVDYDTHRLSFVNKKVLERTPDIKVGEICHKVLSRVDIPCEDCFMSRLDRRNPRARYSEERFNYSTRSWMRYSVSWLLCTPEAAFCLLDCVDISEYFIGP